MVVGDFNDFAETVADSKSALGPLLDHPALENVVSWIADPSQRFTYSFVPKGSTKPENNQIDYILLPKKLAEKNSMESRVGIMRKGMAHGVTAYTGARFASVGFDRPVASDHAPVWVDVNLL